MSGLLQVDAAALLRLSQTLLNEAASIRGIQLPTAVVMPGSPVEAASSNCATEVKLAYGYMAKSIDQMGSLASASATTYEDVDRAFSDQLSVYRAGQ